MITYNDIKNTGIPSGPHIPVLANMARDLVNNGMSTSDALTKIQDVYTEKYKVETIDLQVSPELKVNMTPSDDAFISDNISQCIKSMKILGKTPTVRKMSIMPDACPSGVMGNITVGGVVATENAIHPGMHSADICCSVMATNLGKVFPLSVMDAVEKRTSFGNSGKNMHGLILPHGLKERFERNSFMKNQKIIFKAKEQLGTQGDGNHFYFVGVSENTGDTYVISHHGSRGVGGILFTLGIKTAQKYTRKHCPDALPDNSWIPADSPEGIEYWEALQLVREWTKINHLLVHDMIANDIKAEVVDRFWNEHNSVFKRDGLFYHAKGATPACQGFADDQDVWGRTIVPLNMAEPILIIKGKDSENGIGFAPHGAGRNMSRTKHREQNSHLTVEEMFAEETKNIDARFQNGKVDVSELPSAYKNADSVISDIDKFGLAEVVDRISPFGSVMAGHEPPFWMKTRRYLRKHPQPS